MFLIPCMIRIRAYKAKIDIGKYIRDGRSSHTITEWNVWIGKP